MKEQSHKDEMSAALRGDFQRLRERGVATTLAPGETEVVEAVEPEHESGLAPAPAPEPEPEPEPESRPGWLDRLLGR